MSEILTVLEDLLTPISTYEHPHICIRMSVLQLLRTHLQEIMNLLRKEEEQDNDWVAQAADERFGGNMIRSIRLLASRLSGILLQSNQRRQDIRQLFRTIFNKHLKELAPQPIGRLLQFALKICLQTIDNKFGTSDTSALTPFLVYKSPSSEEASVSGFDLYFLFREIINVFASPSLPANGSGRIRVDSDCHNNTESGGEHGRPAEYKWRILVILFSNHSDLSIAQSSNIDAFKVRE